ncbi:MAG TPA: PD-(D/E)XK nuclease family protein [Ignavibacteriaceae bacterium]|nr:PD-(D/E)XK nuclease family protein [Ignavibacteriaceae bacterium]
MILTKTARKDFDIEFEINLRIRQRNLNSLLMIVPTNRRIRALVRELVSRSPGGAAGKLNIETIGSVSSKLLFDRDDIRTDTLSDAAASVILQQSFNAVQLKYFSGYDGEIPKGTLERIRNVIAEYKRHGIGPAKIRSEAQSLTGSEQNKAFDIADVYEEYQKKLNSSGLKETGDIYSSLPGLSDKDFSSNFAHLYPDVKLIIIMGFDEFTLPEVEIIDRLTTVNKSELFLSFDYFRYNPLIFSHLDSCYNNFLSKGFKPAGDRSTSLFTRFQDEVRENLFRKKADRVIRNYKDEIKVISAATREKEIELIASEIKELILQKGVKPEEIYVVFNLISHYSNTIRDIFPLYGLPFNLTDRFPLDTAPPVTALISFLEIAENDFYYKNIFRALSGGILEMKGINVTNLLRASVNLKIISGFDNWQTSLNEAIISIEENDDDSYDLPGKKESLRKALNDIDKIHDFLDPFLHKMNIPEFRKNLSDLINRLQLPVRLLAGEPDEAEKNIKSLTVLIDTTEEIISLLQDQFGDDEKFSTGFFLHNIRMAVSSSRYNIKEKPGYGVQITTLNEIRGLKCGYLFIGGLCDGDFPTRFSPEIFFSGSMAKVKGEINHLTEERYLFYQSLCTWNKKLYLTFPRQEERKEYVKSDFLREFTNTFEITSGDENEYENTIYTREQLLNFIGEKGVAETRAVFDLSSAGLNLEEIERAMIIDRQRTEMPFTESMYNGFIQEGISEEAKNNLGKMKEREFSISQLEIYAVCPYRYFAERVLKLDIIKEPTEEIEALEMGSLIHSILFNFYSALKKEDIILGNCTDEVFAKAEKLLFSIADAKVKEVNLNSPLSFFEREKIFGIEGRRKNSILYNFLKSERENAGGYVPELFETGFGQVKKDPGQKVLLEELKAGEIKVRGKIDRIDLNKEEKTFKVFDYKTGKSRLKKQDMFDGLQLQLPLYLYAAKEIIKAELNEDYDPAGALIYSLKYKSADFGRKEISFGKNAGDEEITSQYYELIKICLEAINRYVEGISRGDFRLSQIDQREEKACRYCGFRSICRIEEVNS